VAWCVEHFDDDIAHLNVLAAGHSSGPTRPSRLVEQIRRAGLLSKRPAARHMVGVHVCVEHVPNGHMRVRSRLEVRRNVLDGIDNRTDGVTAAPEEIRGADRILMDELSEDHPRTPETFTPITPNFWAVLSFVVPLKQSY